MRERPILFSGPMVRAILEGRKTQTRRVVKDQGQADHAMQWRADYSASLREIGPGEGTPEYLLAPIRKMLADCRYGVHGDRLWVREKWQVWEHEDVPIQEITTRFNNGKLAGDVVYCADDPDESVERWRTSIYMPRWASRITLEVESVRVERVESITEADAVAEGIESHSDDGVTYFGPLNNGDACPRRAFLRLFYDLNKRAPRGTNPWVWVIEFKRIYDPNPPPVPLPRLAARAGFADLFATFRPDCVDD